ncbi:hypothetical protein [Nocardia sp. NPDC050412]|uniref:hypothetical protein n=1 Tax=Nocardia sp. NPDC050412 TaxID=3364320 RepID=UPI00379C54CE
MSEHSHPLNQFRNEVGEASTSAGTTALASSHRRNRWIWVGAALLAGAATHHILLVCAGLFLIYLWRRR